MKQEATPNKGDAGRDNPIILGPAGLLGGPGLNPAYFEAGFRETARAWPPALCCKTMSQPGRLGSGRMGNGVEGPLPLMPCLFSPASSLSHGGFCSPFLPLLAFPALRRLTNFLFCCLAAIGKVLKNRKCPRQENTLKAET